MAAATIGITTALLGAVPAQADTVISSVPGTVPTTSAELTGGFLVPQFTAVPENPAVSPLFYGHDQGAAQPSQPSYFNSRWYDLPPISPDAPDGSSILSNVRTAAPQLSIDQFEGLTIPGEAFLLFGNPSLPNPSPIVSPDLSYPLMWQFTGQGSMAQCGEFAANVVSQAVDDYSGSHPFTLAAQDVPTLVYDDGALRADPGQTVHFTAEQHVTFSQKISATLKSPEKASGITLPVGSLQGTVGVEEEESTSSTYDYHNTSNKVQYYWLAAEADYYTTIGVPYVFYKPANGGPVMAEYPNGLGPYLNVRGTLPSGWTGNLGSWQWAQLDPGMSNDTTLSFPWLSAGTCYVGQSLTTARVLHHSLGLTLMATRPFGTQS